MNTFDTLCGNKTAILECKVFNQQQLKIAVFNPYMRVSVCQNQIPRSGEANTWHHADVKIDKIINEE